MCQPSRGPGSNSGGLVQSKKKTQATAIIRNDFKKIFQPIIQSTQLLAGVWQRWPSMLANATSGDAR